MPMFGLPRQPGRDGKRGGTTNTSAAARPMFSALWSRKPDGTSPSPRRIVRRFEFAQVAIRSGLTVSGSQTIHLVMDNLNIHRRKSLTDLFGKEIGQRSLGPLHRSLHTQAWKLAQSGGNRNRHLLAAMPGQAENPRSEDAAPGSPRLESPDEPRTYQDQLEVRPQSRPPQVRL